MLYAIHTNDCTLHINERHFLLCLNIVIGWLNAVIREPVEEDVARQTRVQHLNKAAFSD
jgi:hypothetical protein